MARFGVRGSGFAVAFLLFARLLAAQDTHLLVVTGVGGDDEHAQNFHKWASSIIEAAKDKGGLTDATITYLGDKPELDPKNIKARSTRANVEEAFADLAAKARPADEVVVILIGHGSFDGKVGAFNLAGPDLNTDDYARLLGALKAQRIVFVNTASSSGAFVQPLAGPGRAIITSTKTGGEKNEPVFAQFFAEAFKDASADTDRNGRISVAEAFEYAKSKAVATYTKAGTILTEHATLDDSREGKFAATLYLDSEKARADRTAQVADPKLRALLQEQQQLQTQIDGLKLKKDVMPEAEYDAQMEKLLTEMALKARAIRDIQGDKK
ncbi:MAG TPA: hypothetical protein VN628_03105 [Vicinamibacterales bacterium]|nr:hypothetical protein [Vicinamibacterales bacterium]